MNESQYLYSCRSDSTGSSLAALAAGNSPASTLITMLIPSATKKYHHLNEIGAKPRIDLSTMIKISPQINENAIPTIPLSTPMRKLSVEKIRLISFLLAPILLSTPISRVLSVTLM